MTKPQRFASSLRLSRLCRWLLTAAAIKVALLVAFALEQPWPFATAAAPPAATVSVVPAPSGQPSQSGVSGAPASTQADAAARTGQAMHAGLAAQAGQTVQSGQDAESQPLAADIARAVGLTAAAAPAPAADGTLRLVLEDAQGKVLAKAERPFAMDPLGNAAYEMPLEVPNLPGRCTLKATAKAGDKAFGKPTVSRRWVTVTAAKP